MLISNFFSKNKNFRNALLEQIPALVISFLLHNTLIHKIWLDLINERQQKTQGFLGKISESHRTNLSMSASWNLQLLESDWITRLVLLCCSVYPFGLWIYCGGITRQQFLSYHWVLRKKETLRRSFRWHSMYFSKEVIKRRI